MRRPSGFTLIEVVIASALILVLVGAFMQLLTSQARVATEEAHDTEAQTGLIRTVSAILPLMEDAKLIAPAPVPSRSIQFRVPLKNHDPVTGFTQAVVFYDDATKKYQFKLGVSERGQNIWNGFYELIFIPAYNEATNTGRSEMLVDEATTLKSNGVPGIDLNQNGNTTDKFVLGSMHLRIYDDTKPTPVMIEDRQIGGEVAVLSPSGTVFTVDTSFVYITLNTLDQRVKAEDSRIRQTTTTIRLRGAGVLR